MGAEIPKSSPFRPVASSLGSVLAVALALAAGACQGPGSSLPAAAPGPAAPPGITPPGAPAGYVVPAPAGDPGWKALDATYSQGLPGGLPQQVPDASLQGPPSRAEDAMARALQEARDARAALAEMGGEIPILDGIPGHGLGQSAAGGAEGSGGGGAVPPAGPIIAVASLDSKDPATTYNVCGQLVVSCARKSGSFDACVDAVPACTQPEPWAVDEDCCPQACKSRYQGARAGGATFLEAFGQTFVQDWSCFPGLPERPPANALTPTNAESGDGASSLAGSAEGPQGAPPDGAPKPPAEASPAQGGQP